MTAEAASFIPSASTDLRDKAHVIHGRNCGQRCEGIEETEVGFAYTGRRHAPLCSWGYAPAC
jgi:hypothetical protein